METSAAAVLDPRRASAPWEESRRGPRPETVRIGVLGCARIAPAAIVRPARKSPDATVIAVGSRSADRARRWARRHRIPRAYGSYEQVLADPDVDAVYVPLPNSLHAQWTIRALDAGKHVLCEKPLAASEREALAMADAAHRTGLVAMEAFHYRHHPLFSRVSAIARSELGELRRVDASLCIPLVPPRDIRWDPALGGGAAMDVGCYAINAVRALIDGEPDVLTASGAMTRRGVDRSFEANLRFPRGVEALVAGSLFGPVRAKLEISGTRGRLSVVNPFLPHWFYRLRVFVGGVERREQVSGQSTYVHQLAAFVDAIKNGTPVQTGFDDAVRNMRVLDRIRSLIGVPVPRN